MPSAIKQVRNLVGSVTEDLVEAGLKTAPHEGLVFEGTAKLSGTLAQDKEGELRLALGAAAAVPAELPFDVEVTTGIEREFKARSAVSWSVELSVRER